MCDEVSKETVEQDNSARQLPEKEELQLIFRTDDTPEDESEGTPDEQSVTDQAEPDVEAEPDVQAVTDVQAEPDVQVAPDDQAEPNVQAATTERTEADDDEPFAFELVGKSAGALSRTLQLVLLSAALAAGLLLFVFFSLMVESVLPVGLRPRGGALSEITSVSNVSFEKYKSAVAISLDYLGGGHEERTMLPVTVGELMTELGKESGRIYESNYPLDEVLTDGMHVEINLIEYKVVTKTESIPFESEVIGVTSIPKGTRAVASDGAAGTAVRDYKQRYVNGKYESEAVVAENVTEAAKNEIVYEGVGGTFKAPNGKTYNYSYYIDVEATAYGVDTGQGGDSPYTYTGKAVKVGMIAVDPDMIPLGSKLYVCGDYADYGVCYAEDIGSAIIGNRIDIYLGTDLEEQLAFGRRSMRVYILE